ncbi:PEP-CTERM sorting domain-containing protein [Massilia sp. P8910]|uniref:PEP-CTERM sorting domain-containing protein n=1 Tax=Massilia antarctica TaxID=2765360 RepID=UPI001E286C39|nr:PEP-CTERM sorting domain-containing protein [Massilia antarctica]MCE3602076.1 PEP-CTERM sorting domain-containing protein [Massilia antarctica]
MIGAAMIDTAMSNPISPPTPDTMKKPMHLAGLLAAALLTTAPMAHALNADVRSSVSQISFSLVDLDLNDGITPMITFTDRAGYRAVYHSWPFDSQVSYSAPGSARITHLGNVAEASSDYTHASSHVSLVTQHGQNLSYSARADQDFHFTLTPHTGLMFSATGNLHAGARQGEDLRGDLFVQLDLRTLDNGVERTFNQTWSNSLRTNGDRDYSLSRYLATGNDVGQGRLYTSTATWADSVSAVPEPATGAMMLAGGVLVGLMARRRRRA